MHKTLLCCLTEIFLWSPSFQKPSSLRGTWVLPTWPPSVCPFFFNAETKVARYQKKCEEGVRVENFSRNPAQRSTSPLCDFFLFSPPFQKSEGNRNNSRIQKWNYERGYLWKFQHKPYKTVSFAYLALRFLFCFAPQPETVAGYKKKLRGGMRLEILKKTCKAVSSVHPPPQFHFRFFLSIKRRTIAGNKKKLTLF